jgi:hypothetical protein
MATTTVPDAVAQHCRRIINISSSLSSSSSPPTSSQNSTVATATARERKSADRFLMLVAASSLCLSIPITNYVLSAATTTMLSEESPSSVSLKLLQLRDDDAPGTAAAAATATVGHSKQPTMVNSTRSTPSTAVATSSSSLFEVLSSKRRAFWQDAELQAEIRANEDCHGKEELLSILYAAGILAKKSKERNDPELSSTNTTRTASGIGVNVTAKAWLLEETCPKLAPWSDVAELYGSQPVVIGMETCARYRQSSLAHFNNNNTEIKNSTVTPPALLRFIRVAGLYNTGTNSLQRTIQCNLYSRSSSFATTNKNPKQQQLAATAKQHVMPSMLLQVPWGKHLPVKYKYHNVHPVFQQKQRNTVIVKNPGLVLPIVVIRDPYRWAQSMVCTIVYIV